MKSLASSEPLISVIIPALNRSHVLEAALGSVRAQTYPTWEVVVVDDGSTDGTDELLRRSAGQDARIRWFRHDKRRGAQAARNTGIQGSDGTWIAFLDSDDQYLPDSLALRIRAALDSEAGAVHSECIVRRPDGTTRPFGIPGMNGDIRSAVLRRPGPMFQGMMVLRNHLESIGGLDETLVAYQEWDTAIRLAERTRFAFVRQPTFLYEVMSDSISSNQRLSAEGYEQVIRKHASRMLRAGGPAVLSGHLLEAARLRCVAGDQVQAWLRVLIATGFWPTAPRAIAGTVRMLARRP